MGGELKPKRTLRERDIERYLKKQIKGAGLEIRKVKWIGRAHAPDRLVLGKGISMWIEVKKPGEKARAGQVREHQRMLDAGLHVMVLDSYEGVDDLIRWVGA